MRSQPPRSATPDGPWQLDRAALREALGLDSEPLPTQIRAISPGLFGPDGRPIVHEDGEQKRDKR